MKTILFSGILALFSFLTQLSFAQKPDTMQLSNSLPVLNGKAVFSFPKNAKNIQREVDIMSADRNANEETRIMLDIKGMHLVFFIQELFALGEDHLFEKISEDNQKDGLVSQVLTDRNNMYSILSTPTSWDSTQDAILLNSLIVKTPDNTLFRVYALINPVAFKWKDQFQKLSEKVFQTLVPGNRQINLAAREENHPVSGTDKLFHFQLPQNYVITSDQKYDFQVFNIRKYRPYSDTNWTNITLYTGYHPHANYQDYGFRESDLEKQTGIFLGKPVSWFFFHVPEEQLYCKEQIIPCNELEEDLLVHIAQTSNQKSALNELGQLVEKITLLSK
ncbi:hypothetical protein [Fluviicola sp.]|jgi:hypothetical protein|uniref:hypothetical protein n=1 Tax=Fluviicola sp. TaxID=1917219 RepID=UPI0028240657|nr:hypothetical protein [Fluviicola sp.]MDR0802894.1 hypothetical protein [Fluviicola sp.]